MLDVEPAWAGGKLVSPPATRVKAFFSDHPPNAEAVLSVTMLCSAEGAHEEAAHFTEFLGEKLGRDTDLQISHWTFEELEHLRPGVVARELAEETRVLALVAAEPLELPVRVRKWIVSWLNQAQPWYALVYLYGTRDGCERLRSACREARVNFFASGFQTHHAVTNPRTRSAPAGFEAEQRRGGSHWGINE